MGVLGIIASIVIGIVVYMVIGGFIAGVVDSDEVDLILWILFWPIMIVVIAPLNGAIWLGCWIREQIERMRR